jgi:hypothetical protein
MMRDQKASMVSPRKGVAPSSHHAAGQSASSTRGNQKFARSGVRRCRGWLGGVGTWLDFLHGFFAEQSGGAQEQYGDEDGEGDAVAPL